MVTKAIQRAAFDEVFHGTLVQFALAHPLQEILHGAEGAAFPALGRHAADQTATHIFHCAHTKADGLALHAEMVLRMVHIRGQHRNAQFLTFGNVAGDLGGRVQHRGHQRRHILPGIVAF